ncbi:helix-turn-helix domain-containing protein [Aquimarina sediminis]|uniref:helix-turn-helix domain-containing protein n=1 Tax=Aquimarina sediminis TaxID=2070536 RepID=UPI000CA07409|nr:AraC family transcriptional regulator [Aquimarina sediminis]
MLIVNKLNNNTEVPLLEVNILFLLAGNISIQTNTSEYQVDKKSYFYYDQKFRITSSSPYLNGFIISLSKEFLNKNPEVYNHLSQIPEYFKIFKINDPSTVKTLIETLHKDSQSAPELTSNYLNLILLKLKSTNEIENTNTSPLFNQFVDLIQDNIENNYCAGTYAKMLDIPLKKLIKEVRHNTDKTPCNIITEQVIDKAKELLTTTNNSSKMIAYQLGFQEPYYFIKYFKKNVGITPTQYRKEY